MLFTTYISLTIYRHIFVKVPVTLLFIFVCNHTSMGQTNFRSIRPQVQKSTLNHLAASNVSLSSRTRVLQSVGQPGVVGFSSTTNTTIQQGYLNTLLSFRINNDSNDEFEESFKFSLYPNPFTDHIDIQFAKLTLFPVLVRVFDMRGRLVHNQQFQPSKQIRIALEHLEEAGYVIRVASGVKSYLKKLVRD